MSYHTRYHTPTPASPMALKEALDLKWRGACFVLETCC